MTANRASGGINQQAIQSVKRMMGMFRAAKNPGAAMMRVAQQNPQIASILQMCNGRNPQDVFYEQCQKMGVDPETIISQLR